jgi:hypothetical protein
MKNAITTALLLAASLAAVACGPSVSLVTPPGFAVLDKQEEYLYRAASADGVAIGVRAEKNEPRGNLDFWAEAVDRQLRKSGYVPEGDPADVRTSAGLTGRETKYKREVNGRTSRFWTVVFVTDKHVFVVEAGGDSDRFKEKAQKGIQKAIESLGIG